MIFISLSAPVLNCISIPFLNKLFHSMSVCKFLLNSILCFFLLFIHTLRFGCENINVRVDQCLNDQEGQGGV